MAAADHLQAPRQHGLFLHHGIDLGDGTVAHYLEGREILRSPLMDFCRGEPISTVDYPQGECSPTGITLRRAMGRLGEQRYNLLFNNCEHFAHWCKTGRHRSSQVEDWLHAGSLGSLALGQFIPAAVLTGARALLRQGKTLSDTLATGLDAEQLERGRELALRSIEKLDGVRQWLQRNLEKELAKADRSWGEASGSDALGNGQFQQLRLAAQNLADQLSAVEEMEAELQQLLEPGRDG